MTSYLEPSRPAIAQERVWARVDLEALRHNVGLIKAMVGPGAEVIQVAKADAYGHGAPAVVRAALSAGASLVGVGDSNEALALIDAGIRAPILILGAIIPGEAERVVQAGIQVSLHGVESARQLSAMAALQGRTVQVHIFVDTGMGRLGARPDQIRLLLDEVLSTPHLELVGLATHFSTPSDSEFTATQQARFEEVRALLSSRVRRPLLVHAAASAALVTYPEVRYGAVRPGILSYGVDPGGFDIRAFGFRPVLSLETQIVHIKDVPAGTTIGYERTYQTQTPTRIATLPVGYHDGFAWPLSSAADVLVAGQRVPVIGRISMDYTTIDLGSGSGDVTIGTPVTIIGRSGSEEIRVEELAQRMATIPYTVLCGIGNRVKRVYDPSPQSLPLSKTPLESSRR